MAIWDKSPYEALHSESRPMSNVTDQGTSHQPRPQQGGCLGGGCLQGCLIVAGLMFVLGLCGGGVAYFWLSKQFTKFTAEQPAELPSVEFEPEQLAELEARIDTFKKAVDDDTTPEEDLVLTADEINALINNEEELHGKVFIKINDGQVTGDVSIPVKDRFLNGSATFNVSLESGVLIVTLAAAEVKGEPVPEKFLDVFSKENLAKDLYKDPKNAEMMRRFERIVIEDDTIVLKLKRDESAEEEGAETSAEEKE